jgi:EF-P beta-lysylation protein EpmB
MATALMTPDPIRSKNKMTILSAPLPVVRPRFVVPRYDSWQEAFKDAVRDPAELCRLLDLPMAIADAARAANQMFPLYAPRGFVARMRPGDPADPLLRQVLPVADELELVAGYVDDPVGDSAAIRQAGLLQKYHGRALLVATGACAVHCRYCFRRHFPYSQAPRSIHQWQPALEQIAEDSSLREIILSGGDPLALVDDSLAALVEQLAGIEHLRRLRIHTRYPIMIPERVTHALIRILRGSRLTPIMVLHVNHANELDAYVAAALARLAGAGIVLLNQAVLLAGVNDSLEAQVALCERLVDLRVTPYYLHQLDPVAGAAHFAVPVATGLELMRGMRTRLPGYAVPRYVQEVAGKANKTVLA